MDCPFFFLSLVFLYEREIVYPFVARFSLFDDLLRITCGFLKLLQVSSEKVIVKDSGGRTVESQLLPLSNATLRIRNRYVKAYLGKAPSETLKYWLAFSASVPPLGFSTYTVSIAKPTG